jgi:glycosyltransferase involved in cell wall biosynthesis
MRLNPNCLDRLSPHVLMLESVLQRASEFDVLHSHIDFLPFPHFRRLAVPSVTTLHGRLDLPELPPLFQEFSDIPVISISDAQRKPLPWARWQGTVYHGLPAGLLTFQPRPGKYLAFLGRLSIEKRVDRALEIARRAGLPLKVAAKVDPHDADYFRDVAEPLMKNAAVDYIGEIDEEEKNRFLGDAYALLFPIEWPEPFGMVMIEAMACGTPVIAYRAGSTPEVVTPGVSGFIVESIEEAVEAVQRAGALPRARVREEFERRFTVERMAADYLQIYDRLVQARASARNGAGAPAAASPAAFPALAPQ